MATCWNSLTGRQGSRSAVGDIKAFLCASIAASGKAADDHQRQNKAADPDPAVSKNTIEPIPKGIAKPTGSMRNGELRNLDVSQFFTKSQHQGNQFHQEGNVSLPAHVTLGRFECMLVPLINLNCLICLKRFHWLCHLPLALPLAATTAFAERASRPAANQSIDDQDNKEHDLRVARLDEFVSSNQVKRCKCPPFTLMGLKPKDKGCSCPDHCSRELLCGQRLQLILISSCLSVSLGQLTRTQSASYLNFFKPVRALEFLLMLAVSQAPRSCMISRRMLFAEASSS